MSELKNKKGFTLVEVVFSTAIFLIFTSAIFTISSNTLKIKKISSHTEKYSSIGECMKNLIIYNSSYDDILNLKNSNRIYASIENVKVNSLKGVEIQEIFTDVEPTQKPYVVLVIEEDEILKITLNIYSEYDNSNVILSFYKGNYYEE